MLPLTAFYTAPPHPPFAQTLSAYKEERRMVPPKVSNLNPTNTFIRGDPVIVRSVLKAIFRRDDGKRTMTGEKTSK